MQIASALARFAHRRRWALVAVFVLLAIGAAVYGAGAPQRLVLGGLEDPESESARAGDVLEEAFGLGEPDVVLAYSHPRARVTDPEFVSALGPVLERLRERPDVTHLTTPYPPAPNGLVSTDGRVGVVTFRLGSDASQAEKDDAFRRIEPLLRPPGLTTWVGGTIAGTQQTQETAARDLERGELITLPLVALLLIVFFRSPILAVFPLLIGGFAIVGALACLRLMTHLTDVSVFALNITTFLGLGVAIDYSLFMTSRFRDEIRAGCDVPSAIARTMATAGRTIAFSGVAVATSLLGALVFPIVVLRSVALSGIFVVLMAVVATLVFLPAGLALLGKRVDLASLRARRGPSRRRWHRMAELVMRAPATVAVVTTALLLVLGAPFMRIQTSLGGPAVLPPDAEARKVAELLESDRFPRGAVTSLVIVVDVGAPVESRAGLERVERYVEELSRVRDVGSVEAIVGGSSGRTVPEVLALLEQPELAPAEVLTALREVTRGDRTVVRATTDVRPDSREAREVVEAVRAIRVPGVHALVGGEAAGHVDLRASIDTNLPWAIAIICLATLVVLFLAFGSIVMPLKAIAMNVLSLTASFGALVWIFQDGRFEQLLDYQSPRSIEMTIPIMMFCVVFGLAMDYELFLLSRIREAYDESNDTRSSVAVGLEETGRIITRAAILLIAVMVGFVTADLLLLKEIGVGMSVAIAVDATIVRILLVPATMELLGRYNWWAPRRLRQLWDRLGMRPRETLPSEPSPP